MVVAFNVEILLPGLRRDQLDRLADAMHAADRDVGIVRSSPLDGPATLRVLTPDADAERARRRAVDLVEAAAAAIGERGIEGLRVGRVDTRRPAAGRARRAAAAPPTAKRATLPDGRVVRAAHEGPLGEWIAWVDDRPEDVWRGRALFSVLWQLLKLPHGVQEPWLYDVIAELAGRRTDAGVVFECPCCDEWTLSEAPPGTYAICPECGWEDDYVQFVDPESRGGANRESLVEARAMSRLRRSP